MNRLNIRTDWLVPAALLLLAGCSQPTASPTKPLSSAPVPPSVPTMPAVEEALDSIPKISLPMQITSSAFSHNQPIPAKYTCDGADINPALQISDVPAGTVSLTLINDDPDAPGGTWVHWLLWNIDPRVTEIKENSTPAGAVAGTTSWRKPGYGGPCPPSGTHRYFFKLYALDTALNLSPKADKAALEKAMAGHILAKAESIGLYSYR